MKRGIFAIAVFLILILQTYSVVAEETRIDVRVISKGAKFVGSSMGGAEVVIADVVTGEILSKGKTSGGTGDTNIIMKRTATHHAPVSTPATAVYHASIELTQPRQISVTARGPLAQLQSIGTVSATQWVLPGKHITGGDGFLLKLPGFSVDVLAPVVSARYKVGQAVSLTANVNTMCGCPVEPGGLWDGSDYEIAALIYRDGRHINSLPLKYAGETSRFSADYVSPEPGVYEIVVYAYDRQTGNTGLDRTTFVSIP